MLDDTYIIFASDNGFFRGEHRIAGGKYLAYDPAAKIPLMIRGPGIAPGIAEQRAGLRRSTSRRRSRRSPTGAAEPAVDGRSFLPYRAEPRTCAPPVRCCSRPTPAREGQRRVRPGGRQRLARPDLEGEAGRAAWRQEPRPGADGDARAPPTATSRRPTAGSAPTATSTSSTPTARASCTTCCSTRPSSGHCTRIRATAWSASSSSPASSRSPPATRPSAARRRGPTRCRCAAKPAEEAEGEAQAEAVEVARLGFAGSGH